MIRKNCPICLWSFEMMSMESLDALIDWELLVVLIDEYENELSLLPLIEERRLKLEASPASKSKLLRMNMLLDDINTNRCRIREIFQLIDDADDNEEDVWKMPAREGLISGDQFEKQSALDGTDMEMIANVLKGSKIGQGIPFLPTSLSELLNIFGKLYKKFEKHGSKIVKTNLLLILEEFLRRSKNSINYRIAALSENVTMYIKLSPWILIEFKEIGNV